MSAGLRWSIVALVVVVGVAVALFSTLDRGTAADRDPGVAAPPADEPRTLADPAARAAADLPACRDAAAPATTGGPLSGFMVGCMHDGSATTLGKIQSGKPMLVNLWAYWCEPCRRELPALRAAQQRLGDRARIVLSHTDPSETKGVDTLRALDMHLVSVSDPEEELPQVLGAPPVLPVSVLVRADGTVARVHLTPMTTEDEVLDLIRTELGVAA